MPTPAVSFAVRHLHTDGGIVVTASHNPKIYNGYKTYGPDGCQMTDNNANAVLHEIESIDMFDVRYGNFDKLVENKMINILEDDVFEAFIASNLRQSIIAKANEANDTS